MPSGSKLAKRRFRTRLAEAQNWRCCYCGCRLEPETATIEHVKPRALGGSNTWENCAAACDPCNSKRGGRTSRTVTQRRQRAWWNRIVAEYVERYPEARP